MVPVWGHAQAACTPAAEGAAILCAAPGVGPDDRRARMRGLAVNGMVRLRLEIAGDPAAVARDWMQSARGETLLSPRYGGVRRLRIRECAVSYGGGHLLSRPCAEVLAVEEIAAQAAQ